MTRNNIQAPAKLSLEEILEAIKQLSHTEYNILVTKLKRIGLYEIQPLPYVVKLEEGKSIEQTLKERGYKGINWEKIDELSKQFNILEPTEGFEEQIYLLD